jgi:hypothetical protein
MATQIIHHEYGAQLSALDDDTLLLNVMCGGVGQYGVEFILNQQEYEQYKQSGDAFLRTLIENVRRYPKNYIARGRTC